MSPPSPKPRLAAALDAGRVLCSLGALVIGVVWVVRYTVSDRFYWSQFLTFVPSFVYAGGCLGGCALASAFYVLRRRIAPARRRPRLLLLAAATLAVLLAHLAVIEFRLYRLPWREPLQVAAAHPEGLRVLYWNSAAAPDENLPETMTLVPADLAIVANPSWGRSLDALKNALNSAWYLRARCFLVFSRHPILRWGQADLGLVGRQQISVGEGEFDLRPLGGPDPGDAVWLELDTRSALGRTTVIWLLDLPSDERSGRWQNALTAAAAMRAWNGLAAIPDSAGNTTASVPVQGFPAPDLILGDFNTPRGAASLDAIAPGLRDAFDQAGAGYDATFPRHRAVVHIDMMRTAPWLAARDYRVIDPGRGSHRMQWGRFEPR